jgi:hypothetical protein
MCGYCGALYILGEDLEPKPTDLDALVDMDPGQRAELEDVQRQIQRSRENSPPPSYLDTVARTKKRIHGWLDTHRKGEAPRLRFPLIRAAASLDRVAHLVGRNERGCELVAYLIRVEPQLTLFMLRVAAQMVADGVRVELVTLSEFVGRPVS